jgi:hypothetical protein
MGVPEPQYCQRRRRQSGRRWQRGKVYSESVSGQDLGAFWPGPGTRLVVLPLTHTRLDKGEAVS